MSQRLIIALSLLLLSPRALPAAEASVWVLEDLHSLQALSTALGQPPSSCIDASDESQLCQWILERKDSSWASLAERLDTTDRIGVLCEIGEKVAGDRCSAHPRRSNRMRFRALQSKRQGGGKQRRPKQKQQRADLVGEAQREIAAASTLVELSRSLGSAPNSCFDDSDSTRLCTWRLSNHTYGHGTAAAVAEIDTSKKVRMRCTLTRDGSPRASGSCITELDR